MTRCAKNRTERRRLRRKILRRIREDVIVQDKSDTRTLVIRSGVPDHMIIDAPVGSIWFDGCGKIVR